MAASVLEGGRPSPPRSSGPAARRLQPRRRDRPHRRQPQCAGPRLAQRHARHRHWIAIRASEDGPNRDAIGGWVEVRCGDRVQRRELTIGGGHAGGALTWTHFGLGAATEAEARVIWPDGEASDWSRLAGDAFYVLGRGRAPDRWTPPG